MPYLPRRTITKESNIFHITWQFHNKDWFFSEYWAKHVYYSLMLTCSALFNINVYCYAFMDSHAHFIFQSEVPEFISKLFHKIHTIFAIAFNKRNGRRGQVFMDRFKTIPIKSEKELLRVMAYIDLNQKRAGKVKHPRQNKFSSYKHYALGIKDELITEVKAYLDMGINKSLRQRTYRKLIESKLKTDWEKKMQYSSEWVIGDISWVDTVSRKLRAIMRDKRDKWKKGYKERFGMDPSEMHKLMRQLSIIAK
ncbi:MAG: transposase [Pseudomonadota bacterium]